MALMSPDLLDLHPSTACTKLKNGLEMTPTNLRSWKHRSFGIFGPFVENPDLVSLTRIFLNDLQKGKVFQVAGILRCSAAVASQAGSSASAETSRA